MNPTPIPAEYDAALSDLLEQAWKVSHLFNNRRKDLYDIAISINSLWSEDHPHFEALGNSMCGIWTCADKACATSRFPNQLRRYYTPANPPLEGAIKCPVCKSVMEYDEDQ